MAQTNIFKVLGCGDLIQMPSQKSEGGFISKRTIRRQEFGGSSRQDAADRASNAVVANMVGGLAQCMFYNGDIVMARLRMSIREYQGTWYQDITVVEITKLK